jgi:hypothetical protein
MKIWLLGIGVAITVGFVILVTNVIFSDADVPKSPEQSGGGIPYVPIIRDRDCKDFANWQSAQAFYEAAGVGQCVIRTGSTQTATVSHVRR